MKIIHLCLGAFFVDNFSYQENILAKYHVKQGYDVTVIASLFSFDENGKGFFLPGPSIHQDKDGFNVIRLGYKKPLRWNRFFRQYEGLYDQLEKIAPDIIFIHGVQFGDARLVRDYLRKNPNVVLYADNHADYVNSAKNWMSKHFLHSIIWRHSAKLLEPYMTKFWGVTPLRCRFLMDIYHINPQLVDFLPMGVDDESIPADRDAIRKIIREELGVSNDEILIFTGGKIDKLKNTHVLINAFLQLNNPQLHMVICGALTHEMGFLKKIIDANLNIHYLGWCDAERVMNCMIASDFACFPGTHSTLWEQAVGVGLPIVCKLWDGMEHVDVNGNCIFVKGDDLQELQVCLSNICQLEKLRETQKNASIASLSFLYSNISKKAIGR